ncbi:hypothetical protein P3T37_000340 [Kitasatospora sp. MAA4]|uniref:hypothetical protein n=1 Tax=Kitasatospora sp. MAA4 TaxID=3035093 RepID=UPI002475BF3C|nr:hypothetical protein [Kitasatospora sp. MAA4]MDH6130973.1 hypothetical protein [Kitasatospora sp. MAA4]
MEHAEQGQNDDEQASVQDVPEVEAAVVVKPRRAATIGSLTETNGQAGAAAAVLRTVLDSVPSTSSLIAEAVRNAGLGFDKTALQIARQVAESSSILESTAQMQASRSRLWADIAEKYDTRGAVASVMATFVEVMQQYDSWADQAGQVLESVAAGHAFALEYSARSVAEVATASSLRALDLVTPEDRRLAQFTATASLVERSFGTGALTSWRTSLAADIRIEEAYHLAGGATSDLVELARISRAQVGLTDWAVLRDPGAGLLGAATGRAVIQWEDFLVHSLPAPRRVGAAPVIAGRTTLGLVSTDLLSSTDLQGLELEETAERIDDEVLAPWQEERLGIFGDLHAVLRELDPNVPELLEGAWHSIHHQGPAVAVTVANLVVEVVDRTLRAAAPDDVVRAWHTAENRSQKEWEGQDRPPHALRVVYLASKLGGDRQLVQAQADAFAMMVRRIRNPLQKVKHASKGDLAQVRLLLLNSEYLLMSLLLNHGHDWGPGTP